MFEKMQTKLLFSGGKDIKCDVFEKLHFKNHTMWQDSNFRVF